MSQGVIIEGRGGLYTVADAKGAQHVLRAKGIFRLRGQTPLVGDRVRFTPGTGEEHGWVDKILPRTSECLRPPVANIELLCIVVAPEPEPDWLLVDKLLLFARLQRIHPLLVVNKADISGDVFIQAQAMYRGARVDVLSVSALKEESLVPLREAMLGSLACLAGQSGVGKSHLISTLLGVELESGSVSRRTRRGRQTTRHISLLEERGLRVLDTPGFSLLEAPGNLEAADLPPLYPEFDPYLGRCYFSPCLHDREPGCAVIEAEAAGLIDAERMARYRVLLDEIKQNWRDRYG